MGGGKRNRFNFLNDDEIKRRVNDRTPVNTVQNTKWAINQWNAWAFYTKK